MKRFLRMLADLALMPVSGCVFPPNRDGTDARDDSEAPARRSEIKEAMKPMDAVVPGKANDH